MSAAQKTAILAQVRHFYFGTVHQCYVSAATMLRHERYVLPPGFLVSAVVISVAR